MTRSIKEMAASEFETAMSFGISRENFERLARYAYEQGKKDAVPEGLIEDAKIIFCSDSEANTNGGAADVIEWFSSMLTVAAAPKQEK